jgi:lycopene cyclase domain-containing protein
MEYTYLAVASVVVVVAYELLWLRSGLLADRRYWIALGICFGFMLLVNGWFTKLSAPIVIYDADRMLGLRVPWDIPVEDYLFGWSLLTAVLARWKALGERGRAPTSSNRPPTPSTTPSTMPASTSTSTSPSEVQR